MRILADNCVPTRLIQQLRQAGHEVTRVVDLAHQSLPDAQVARLARQLDTVLLTLDSDFRSQRNFPYRSYPGIILLHGYAGRPERVTRRLLQMLEKEDAGALSGALTIVQPRANRRRR